MPTPDLVESGFRQAAVVIPAHDEAKNLPRTLRAVLTASACAPVPVDPDSCPDTVERLAGRYGPDVSVRPAAAKGGQ